MAGTPLLVFAQGTPASPCGGGAPPCQAVGAVGAMVVVARPRGRPRGRADTIIGVLAHPHLTLGAGPELGRPSEDLCYARCCVAIQAIAWAIQRQYNAAHAGPVIRVVVPAVARIAATAAK